MNDEVKKEIDRVAQLISVGIAQARPQQDFILKDLEYCARAGAVEFYPKGDKDGYNRAVKNCIGIVKQHRVDGKILWDIIKTLQQLKLKESADETPTK